MAKVNNELDKVDCNETKTEMIYAQVEEALLLPLWQIKVFLQEGWPPRHITNDSKYVEDEDFLCARKTIGSLLE